MDSNAVRAFGEKIRSGPGGNHDWRRLGALAHHPLELGAPHRLDNRDVPSKHSDENCDGLYLYKRS